jgi:general secretion pathway protein K
MTEPGRRLKARSTFSASEAGGALLFVLWITAALTAIALAVATTVRGETERTTTSLDSLKAYYLATGAIERALLYTGWAPSYRNPDGTSRYWNGESRLAFEFPTGEALVEIIPEAAKMNVNEAPPEDLYRLLLVLGADAERAREITLGIIDWRTAARPPQAVTPFDQFYLSRDPSFRARHASLEEIEELLLIKGMTPELFYGGYVRGAEGRLAPRPGLLDCVSVYGTTRQFDVNTVQPAVLEAMGLPPDFIGRIVEVRRRMPIRNGRQLQGLGADLPGFNRLRVGGNSIFTFRATARLRTPGGAPSELRRSAAAVVKFLSGRADERYQVLRWYDNAWVQ